MIGEVLRERGGAPEGVVVSTKVDPDQSGDFSGARAGARWRKPRAPRYGLPPARVPPRPERATFEDAMAPDGPVPALVRLKEEGVVGHLGVAGGPVGLRGRFVRTGVFEAVLTHNRFTLLDRSATSLLDECARSGVAVCNAAPFGGGMLARGPARKASTATTTPPRGWWPGRGRSRRPAVATGPRRWPRCSSRCVTPGDLHRRRCHPARACGPGHRDGRLRGPPGAVGRTDGLVGARGTVAVVVPTGLVDWRPVAPGNLVP